MALTVGNGSPSPLGASLTPDGTAYNFALYSLESTAATLMLYATGDLVNPAMSITFDPIRNRSGAVWHCSLQKATVEANAYYAYSVAGTNSSGMAGFDASKVLLDPYAQAVFFPPNFSRTAASTAGSNAGMAPLGVIPIPRTPFDWTGDMSPPRHTSDTIVYEMHVKGFTNNPNSGVADNIRGTFLGAIRKIPYLQDLGVTVVELMPIYLFDPEPGGDYWGYMPLSFFAPHRGYSNNTDPAGIIDEFKALVKAFHAAGIEVVLDVVYNHTTEQGVGGPTYSYRGIDNDTYYIVDNGRYVDVTGCGNSVDTGEPAVRKLVVDSLRYWVEECHVDGFRFDLAGIFSRNIDGSVDPSQPVAVEISSDPAFAGIRLIAEPYDATNQNFELGRKFPGTTWAQWNTDYRDQVRQFVIQDQNTVPNLITRIYGSAFDLFPDSLPLVYNPFQSVNYINCHDGFTLYDLVSYNQSHNQANAPGQLGGPTDNYSNNCGFEGDDGAPAAVLALRRLRVKGFFAILMVSNGTPMFVMGDEILRTQGGNNNPYNQDTATSWVDWSLQQKNADIYRFFKMMIAFRKAHPSIARGEFWRGDITWYGVSGGPDFGPTSNTLAFCLRDPQGFGAPGGFGSGAGPSLYVIINFYTQDLTFDLQEGAPGSWKRAVDTSMDSPNDIVAPGSEIPVPGSTYTAKAQSVVILVSS